MLGAVEPADELGEAAIIVERLGLAVDAALVGERDTDARIEESKLAEAVLQLQGRCGARQVEDAEVGLVTSGALQDGSALVLTRRAS